MNSLFINNFYYCVNNYYKTNKCKAVAPKQINIVFTKSKVKETETSKDIHVTEYLNKKYELDKKKEKLEKIKKNVISKEKLTRDVVRIKDSILSLKDKLISKFRKNKDNTE